MSNEINTVGAIQDKFGGYWVEWPRAQCMTKAEIVGSGVFNVNGSYGDTECPKMDDIAKKLTPNIIYVGVRSYNTGYITYYARATYPVTSEIHFVFTTNNTYKYNQYIYVGQTSWQYDWPLTRDEEITAIDWSPTEDGTYSYDVDYNPPDR